MIVLENLHKSLGGRPVLKGVDLRVEKSETLVIVGSSGTGKSVTLKHIVGLLEPDAGRVLIDGEDIIMATVARRTQILERFGMLFQSGALINWLNVFENIALPLYEKTNLGDDEIQRRVRDKLGLVNLSDCEHKRTSELSGGMKKRVGLARAIISEPEILLYDEPTSGLDPVMSRHIDKLIVTLQKELGVTSVVVTHDLHSAFTVGDRIAMLYDGRIAELGEPKSFVQSTNRFVREFIDAQFKSGKLKELTLL